ncbi:hypothetical protein DH96_00705 [Candidatus Phytoplasma oryzae]|uniref:Uncharacterized protein n=1 Tax=Candidatus Phytoplasma oryzae TaxID=203274 RepID=A0A328IM47_9MOLU|nr:hypothetical protein DH96_00705 [Candidatus Phytoplasma oryzae]
MCKNYISFWIHNTFKINIKNIFIEKHIKKFSFPNLEKISLIYQIKIIFYFFDNSKILFSIINFSYLFKYSLYFFFSS